MWHATEDDLARLGPAARLAVAGFLREQAPQPAPQPAPRAQPARRPQPARPRTRRGAVAAPDRQALAMRLHDALREVATARDPETQRRALLALVREVGAVGAELARR